MMTLESHIRRLLLAEDAQRPDPIDSYDSIVTRAKKRRRVHYASRVAAVAAVLGLVVVGTGLLLNGTEQADTGGAEVIPIAPVTSSVPDDVAPEACDPTSAIRLAEEAATELGQADATRWQDGLAGPNRDRMPTAHDLAVATGLGCEWEGSIPSPEGAEYTAAVTGGEWITAAAAWSGEDMLGVVRLTHPLSRANEGNVTYWFEQTGAISGTWVTPSIFAGAYEDEPVAVFRLGNVEPPLPPSSTTTTPTDFGVCPQVVPEFLPEGVEGRPGTQSIVWESTGATPISIARSTDPDHPAASLSNTTTVDFNGGSASYVSLRPGPRLNFAARIDIDGTDPACGFLFATFDRLDSEDVERILASLTIVQP
ncbi:MAG: hypothetical protein GY926_27310 [bacterium]|nr:hypothetical protein [bacterium]